MAEKTTLSPEQEREAERNRRALIEVSSAALPLLLQRRDAAVQAGLKAGGSLDSIAGRIATSTKQGINEVRALSRASGVARLRSEASSLGRSILADASWLPTEVVRDINRSSLYSDSYAKQWLKKANEAAEKVDSAAKVAKAANADTIGSLKRTAVTESSEAFSSGRAKYLRASSSLGLLRVWDARLDKRTCPICGAADGTIVGAREPFPQGEPGSVHPGCLCSWSLLSSSQDDRGTLIEPRETTRVQVAVPAAVKPKLPAVANVGGGKISVDAETKAWAKRLDVALGNISKDGGAAAREELRAMLGRFGYKTQDLKRGAANVIKIGDTGDMAGLQAFHNWDGSLTLSDDVVKHSRGALRKLQLGVDPGDSAERLSVLLHEELHGASAMSSAAYSGPGAALEEAATELAARRITKQLVGRDVGNIYLEEIDGIGAVLSRYSKAKPEALAKKIDDAIVSLKSKAKWAETPHQHVDEFVKALKLRPKQSASVLRDLTGTPWWMPEHQGKVSPLKAIETAKPKPVKITKKKATGPPKPKKVAKKPTVDAKAKTEKARLAAEEKAAKAQAAAEAKAARAKAAADKKTAAAADKLSDKQIKDALKVSGIKVIGKVSEDLRLFFGTDNTPQAADIRAMLGADSLNRFGKFKGEISINPLGITFRGGGNGVTISRTFFKTLDGEIVVKHDSLYLSAKAQGQKLGSSIVKEQVSAYERLGIGRVTLDSAEVGRYYWPKIGFEASAEELARTKSRMGLWLERSGVKGGEAIAGRAKSMRDLATLQVDDRKVGKEFLLSKDYGGTHLSLRLDRSDAGYRAFRQEFGLEPKPHVPDKQTVAAAARVDRRVFDDRAERFAEFLDGKPERIAFELYTGEHYKRINGDLRSGKSTNTANAIQRALEKAHKEGLSAPGEVYRGVMMSDAELVALTPGSEPKIAGFLSTTIDEERARRYALPPPNVELEDTSDIRVVLKIRQKTAVPIDGISSNRGEEELLMRHNTQFRVLSKRASEDKIGNLIEVELEEIP
jgi:hypothetical protein